MIFFFYKRIRGIMNNKSNIGVFLRGRRKGEGIVKIS